MTTTTHHYMGKPEYLEAINEHMTDLGPVRRYMDFDSDFVLVEPDWAAGTEPEVVARTIHKGAHTNANRSEFFAG